MQSKSVHNASISHYSLATKLISYLEYLSGGVQACLMLHIIEYSLAKYSCVSVTTDKYTAANGRLPTFKIINVALVWNSVTYSDENMPVFPSTIYFTPDTDKSYVCHGAH